MPSIVHIITDLDIGGAEMMLHKVITNLDRNRFASRVVSLTGDGPVGERIRRLGVPVHTLNMIRGRITPARVVTLARWLRVWKPDVVQTWMYHSDLAGSLAARLGVRSRIVWNIRHGNLSRDVNSPMTLKVAKACALLSRWIPCRIVCCSDESRELHASFGYARRRLVTIPNGFDCDAFRPDSQSRADFRRERSIPPDAILIGIAGRFDVQKDYRTFVRAARQVQAAHPSTHFLLCGRGIDQSNPELTGWLGEEQLTENVHLLGMREDMPRIFAALDIAVSSSTGEGFSNVLGEAMASGVPCVATNVGSAAMLIGQTGRIVPPSQPEALAGECSGLIEAGAAYRRELGQQARSRMLEHFSIKAVARRYEQLYEDIAQCAA
ncbi:MAG TPA: glycosyltransferase [Bryobacteraceae bacterium]|jgi:glycosyltransferase involved in cell wall biosynthesis|nr:glycosyltransferase [Bryobacteraceae bacterium]